MSLGEAELSQFLVAAGLLLLFAHLTGTLFARLRQPRVVGEIVGGLLLGATVLGAIAPELQSQLFPDDGAAASGLATVYQLGLIWLMFAAGIELRLLLQRTERAPAIAIAFSGIVLPFAIGLAAFEMLDPTGLQGSAHDRGALALVFAIAIAVTSIPVISRIMLDLGLLSTSFARVVLGAAVIEDVVLYGVLAVAIGLAHSGSTDFGLAAQLGIDPASVVGALYYAGAIAASLGAAIAVSRLQYGPSALLNRIRTDMAWQLLFVLAVVATCSLANVPPLFGGLVAGIVVSGEEQSEATQRLRGYGLAFFVPIYFAIVGFRLDLGREFDLVFFATFLIFACGLKAGSVYLGARLAGEPASTSRHLAVAMNARGGPGIVLASVALDAGIIDGGFYASLVMLAIVTSLLAGWWLERVVRQGVSLREVTAAASWLRRPQSAVAQQATA